MRFDAALSYLVLSAAVIASATAAEYKESDNAPPTRKRTLRATASNANINEADAEIVSTLRAPADAPVAAAAVGDSSGSAIMTPQEEEDVRLLRLDDAQFWKKFLGDDQSMPDGCNFDVRSVVPLHFVLFRMPDHACPNDGLHFSHSFLTLYAFIPFHYYGPTG